MLFEEFNTSLLKNEGASQWNGKSNQMMTGLFPQSAGIIVNNIQLMKTSY